jgi:hypothetical protein
MWSLVSPPLTPASTYLLPLKINIESRTLALECFGSSFPNCAEVHFFGFTSKACKVFLGVLKHLGTLSLSLMTLFMHKKDHSLDSLTPRIPCPASRHLSVLNHEFVLPGVVPAQNWDAGQMTCNLTHLTNPWLGWPKCKPTQLSKPPPCHPGLSSRSRTLLPISKSSPLSW